MVDTPYLGAARSAVSPAFAHRHRYTNDGLHDVADQLRTELSNARLWRPLIEALERAVTSPPGMAFIRSFPHADRVHAANMLASVLAVAATAELRRRLEVAATRR